MSFTDFLELELLDHLFNNGAYTAPANLFVSLSTTTPTDAGGNFTEHVGDAYARVSTAAADWITAAAGLIDNSNVITFPTATGSWGTMTHFGIFDALTGGNLLATGALDTSKLIGNGDTAEFAVGDHNTTLD